MRMPPVGPPLLLGHRGARGIRSIPENTFASFDRALADGCDGFEFDVRVTSDGGPVVCHDPRFKRIEIAQATADRLPELPLLEQVLDRYAQRAFLDIELKVAGVEGVTASLLRNFPPRRGFVISSFLPNVLERLHALNSTIPLGLICEKKKELLGWSRLPIEYVIPHKNLAQPRLLEEWKGAQKKVLVWTVNELRAMRRLRDWGVDGIISDDPALLAKTLANSTSA